MRWIRSARSIAFASIGLPVLAFGCARCHAQIAVLMEEPYGFFGSVAPGGHSAVYLDRVCAETPLKLRRCKAGELGAVLTREPDVAGFDWVAIPLLPYLYSVENASEVPKRVNRNFVWRMRHRYHETRLLILGEKLQEGNFFKGGWGLLVGQAYERRMFAFRFETTPEQDDALIARLNAGKNHTRFQYLFNNCADFTRKILNLYFPGAFPRLLFPDAGMTTPKQVTARLVRFARKHPELNLSVFEISQVPGYRRHSGSNRTVFGSLTCRGYLVPVAMLNPYVAGGMLLDYLAEGHERLVPRDAPVLGPDNLLVLKVSEPLLNPAKGDKETAGNLSGNGETADVQSFNPSQGEIKNPDQ